MKERIKIGALSGVLRVTQKRGGYQKLDDKLFFFSLDGNTTTLAEIAI